MNTNGEETKMTDAEFQQKLDEAINFLAQAHIQGGIWKMEDDFFKVQAELEGRGMPTLGYEGDSRVEERISQITQEKAQARENDPEGYEAAQRKYRKLLQAQLEKGYEKELGEIDASETGGNNSVVEELNAVVEKLFKYELQRREWWYDLRQLRQKVSDRKQEIIDELPGPERKYLEIEAEIEGLRKSQELDERLGSAAAWHPGDKEHNGFMSGLFRDSARQTGDKIGELQQEMDNLPTVRMVDILRRAINDVQVSMEDVKGAETQVLDVNTIREDEGVNK